MAAFIYFLIPAVMALSCLLVCATIPAFRSFLIAVAVASAIGGDIWAFHRYGFYGMPTIGDSYLRAHLPCVH
jgi:hypothetical protein